MNDLQQQVEALFAQGAEVDRKAGRACVKVLRDALSAGTVRSAEPDTASASGWHQLHLNWLSGVCNIRWALSLVLHICGWM